MFSRSIIFLALIAGAVVIPYTATKSPSDSAQSSQSWGDWFASLMPSSLSSGSSTIGGITNPDADIPAANSPLGPGAFLYPNTAPIEGISIYKLEEVLRMDITKEWIYGRWSRKSTAIAHPEWFGIRVPLVTGTQVNDLAGSLTYYFDDTGRVQHLSFHGRTGDTGKLIHLLVQYYGMQRQTPDIAGGQLYQNRWGTRIRSELRTQPSPVLWASSPHNSFSVDLELARPGSNRFLTSRAGQTYMVPKQTQQQPPTTTPKTASLHDAR